MKKIKQNKPKNIFPTCINGFRLGGGSNPVTNFPSIVSKFIVFEFYHYWMDLYHEFPQDTYVIIDSSTGWNGRLVGVLGSYTYLRNRYRETTGRELSICYLTTDPHEKIHKRSKLINNDWFKRIEPPDTDRSHFIFRKRKVGSETPEFYDFCKSKMDELGVSGGNLSLTSPPYFNREQYSGDSGQSNLKYGNNYERWRNGFLKGTINNISNLLLPNGRFYLNIADVKEGKVLLPLESDSLLFGQEFGIPCVKTYKMLLSSSGKGCKNVVNIIDKGEVKQKKFEPIFILEKHEQLN